MFATLLIGLIAIFLTYEDWKNKVKNGYEYAFIIITAFLAVRYDFGMDYMGYMEEFYMYDRANVSIFNFHEVSNVAKSELGWVYLMLLFRPFGFFGFVFLLTIVENLILYDFIKRNVSKEWRWLAIFIYVFYPTFLLHGCAMMRQWLAITIIVFSTRYVEKYRIIPFAICIMLAFFFHKSALVGILVLLLSFIYSPKASYIFGGALAILVFYSFSNADKLLLYTARIFESDIYQGYEHYTEQTVDTSMNLFGIISTFTMPIVCGLMIPKFKKNEMLFLLLYLVSIIFIPLRSMSQLVLRMEVYFSVFSIALFPIVISKIKKPQLRVLLAIFVILTTASGYVNIWRAPSSSWMSKFHEYHTIFSTWFN